LRRVPALSLMSRSASTWTVTVATAVLLTLGVVAVQSQAPTPTFRVQVESVEVSARVSDAQGRFVRGLTADDFEVLEDGRPQAITSVRLVDLPFEPATQRSVMTTPKNDTPEPDVSTNARVFDGRLYILLLDEQHVLPAASELVRRAARRFIDDHLAPGDQMAVVGVGASDKYSQ